MTVARNMPVIRDIDLDIGKDDVLRRQGISKRRKVKPETEAATCELLESLKTLHLLQTAVTFEIYDVSEISADHMRLKDSSVLLGGLFSSVLQKVRQIAIVVCTLGPKLEEASKNYFMAKKPVRGLLLDGIGSAAVDCLEQEACSLISQQATLNGYLASSPISPGMPEFPLSEQRQVLKLAHAAEIGVSLTSSGVMQPLKSASMVVGIGQNVLTWTAAQACASCNMYHICHYRIYNEIEER